MPGLMGTIVTDPTLLLKTYSSKVLQCAGTC